MNAILLCVIENVRADAHRTRRKEVQGCLVDTKEVDLDLLPR